MKNQMNSSNSLSIKLLISLMLLSFCVVAYGQILVSNAAELNAVRNNLGGNYIQTADIDLSEYDNWQPIGTSRNAFTGTYNGDGHKILNLTIERPAAGDIALFGGLGTNGSISNLGLENADVTGASNTAILVAQLVGGTIDRCYASGEVTGNDYVGGLVGQIRAGDANLIRNSYAVGVVNGVGGVGGLVGDGAGGNVVNCYASVYLTGNPDFIGGLIGRRTGGTRVTSGFWDTEVSTVNVSAGGTGLPTESMLQSRTYSREWDMREIWGIVDQETYPYLLWQRGPGEHNYPPAEGSPSGLTGRSGDGVIVLTWVEPPAGEWIAYNIYRNDERYDSVERDVHRYEDREVVNYTQYSYFVKAIWEDETESRPSNVVLVTPHLPFADGDGTEENPYQVATARHLNDMRFQPTAHYIQIADINIGVPPWNDDTGWEPIGYWVSAQDNRPFKGSYNGNGHSIERLSMIAPDRNFIGLFGYLQSAHITNLILEDVRIFGNNNVGAITARAVDGTTLTNCYVSGEIEAGSIAGGLVAHFAGGDMTNCHFTGILSGGGNLGGLVSEATSTAGTISNCSVDAVITGTGRSGGIAATNNNVITDCSFIGTLTGGSQTGGITGTVAGTTGRILNCYVNASITGNFTVGGIAGQTSSSAEIHNCYAIVELVGYRTVGGIVASHGANMIAPIPNVTLTNSYVRGSVTGSHEVDSMMIGGVAGWSNGRIENCYSTAVVSGPPGREGGLVVTQQAAAGVMVNSYWDTEASGIAVSTAGEGRLTRQMVHPYDIFTYINWDFDEIWNHDPDGIANDGYPILFWQEIPTLIDAPVVSAEIINVDGAHYSLISWEAVEGANSYKVFAANIPNPDDWGDPVTIIEETEYQEAVAEAGNKRFYRVVASVEGI